MALTRDQFDVIANSYNDRQLNNKIKLNRRIEEVYEKIPLIKDLDGQIGVLAGRALRLSLSGNSSAKDTLREDIALISEQKKAAENIDAVVDHCHYFINNFDKTFDNLLFYGRAGTGKTFLINCIAKELIEKSYSVIYLSAVQLFDLLADYSFKRSNTTIYRQISFDELLRCDLLIIDDLGTEMSNSFTESSLFDCLNERLIHQKSTIISTNFSLQELQQKYEERIFSRTAGNYTPLKIFGDDIRIKKKFTI